MKVEMPSLFTQFEPTEGQLTYFLIVANKDLYFDSPNSKR